MKIIDNYGTLDAFFASEKGADDVVKSLLNNGIISQQEVAGLTERTDKGYLLSPAGKDYVTDLLLGALFDEQTIRLLGSDKGLKQSILRALPAIVENRRLGDYALSDDINGAIRLLYEARRAGMTYGEFIRQTNAFEGAVADRYSAFEMLLAEEMQAGVEQFRQVLNLYNQSAKDEANGQTGMFEPRTAEYIKQEILDYYAKQQPAATRNDSGREEPASVSASEPATESASPQTEPAVSGTQTGDGQVEQTDKQGNPLNSDGTLKFEQVESIDQLTNEDFTKPSRSVQLPELAKPVNDAIVAKGKPVVIKKNIFEKNLKAHAKLTPEDSRKILNTALYNPNLYGQNQKTTRPNNWILIHIAETNTAVLLEVAENKDNVEIISWHYLDDYGIQKKQNQAIKEGGQILKFSTNPVADTANDDLISADKDTTNSATTQEGSEKKSEEQPKEQPKQESKNTIFTDEEAERLATQTEVESLLNNAGLQVTLDADEAEMLDNAELMAVSNEILRLFNDAKNGELTGKPIQIGKLTQEGRKFLEQLSGLSMKEDIDFRLNPSDLVHIYNDHYGNNEKDKGNNIPLTDNDIQRIVDVIAFPTDVVFGVDKQGRNMFYFLRQETNGTYNLLEIYADSKGNLTTKTYYKTKKGVSQRVMDIQSLLSTSKTYSGSTLSTAKIPQIFESAKLSEENNAETEFSIRQLSPTQK